MIWIAKAVRNNTREFFQILFPDTDRGMDVITSQSHYKQFMISQRWARDRDTVETYASLVFLFIFSQSPSSSPSLFSALSATCTPRSRNRFTRMSDEWWRACRECRDTMSTWQNRKMEEGGSRCARIFVKRSVMKATPAISRRYFRVALFKTNEENRAAFVATKTSTQRLFLQRNRDEVSKRNG